MSPDPSHLGALELALSHERERLSRASNAQERALRTVWVAGLEREVSGELAFLGITREPVALSDDELFNELSACAKDLP